jgi:hypothetical protein
MALLDDAADLLPALASAHRDRPRVDEAPSIQTLYWGAHRFHADAVAEIGDDARALWAFAAPDAEALARILGWEADAIAEQVHAAVSRKLVREPIEDIRIDFEDGYGVRPDAEEDAAASEAGAAAGRCTMPRRFGIRFKPLQPELARRSIATLDRFATAMVEAAHGLPNGFVLTVPKVTSPDQCRVAVELLHRLERKLAIAEGSIALEIMIEVPQALFDAEGRLVLPAAVAASGDRLVGVHLGVYDFTAAWEVPALYQSMSHPACDFVRALVRATCSGTGLVLSAGSTNVLPVEGNVEASWRRSHDDIRHALVNGWYHGWDLHAGQLPVRYATSYRFYREGLPAAVARLRAYARTAAAATEGAATLDDAPTVAALQAFVRRAIACGAADAHEV